MPNDVSGTNLGEALRSFRLVRNLSVQTVADDIGISKATLSRMERGGAMDGDTVVKVLNWLVRAPGAQRQEPAPAEAPKVED